MAARRPLLLAFEGVDGAGKSSVCAACADELRARGEAVEVLREPGGTAAGEAIRSLLLEESILAADPLLEALLFSASRRQLVLEKIAPAQAAGRHVFLDRSFLSTWVYQGLAAAEDVAVPVAKLEEWTRAVHGAHWPDRVLLLDLPDELALARRRTRGNAAPDKIEARGAEFLRRVNRSFRELAKSHADLVQPVDASPALPEVVAQCMSHIDALPGGA